MSITKQSFLIRSLKRIGHKGWETFVITRLLHGLDDDSIEFVTQQLVLRPNGQRALTDIFFPQFSLHVEVDEGFHSRQLKEDEKRERDIVASTGHTIRRVVIGDAKGVNREMTDIRNQVDQIISELRQLKKEAMKQNRFVPWDLETRYLAEPVIERGYLDVGDNVLFRLQVEALKCFGFSGKGYQRGAWVIPDDSGDVVWFPRLYRHGNWRNRLIEDGTVIREEAIDEKGRKSIRDQKRDEQMSPGRKHIVFAKSTDALGFSLLRYVGTFVMVLQKSTDQCIVFERLGVREPIRTVRRSRQR